MAIVFELVINFGSDRGAADEAVRLVRTHPPLTAGQHRVLLHDPLLNVVRGIGGEPYLEMSIVPARVGWKVGLDRGEVRLALTAAELTELGAGLYRLLRQLTDYRVAQVGWDPEGLVDLAKLEQEWADEIAAGQMDGLVLAEGMRHQLGTDAFKPFVVGFIWIPYRGEPRTSLAADGPSGT